MTTLVLSATLREAYAYGQSREIRVRHASTPDLVNGHFTEIVELPSWKTYRARHAVAAAVKSYIRRKRDITYRYDGEWDYKTFLEAEADANLQSAQDALGGSLKARRELTVRALDRALLELAAIDRTSSEAIILAMADDASARLAQQDVQPELPFGEPPAAVSTNSRPLLDAPPVLNIEPSPAPEPIEDAEVTPADVGVTVHESAGTEVPKPAPKKRRAPVKPTPPVVNPPAEF